jgi:hypothetical protein
MKTIDLLKFVKAQLIHMEEHLRAIDEASSNGTETVHEYPLASNTGALFLIDLALQEKREEAKELEEMKKALAEMVREFDDNFCEGSVPHTVLTKSKKLLDKIS